VLLAAGKWCGKAEPAYFDDVSLASFLERALPLGILAVSAVSVPFMMLSPEGMPRMRSLERDLGGVSEENRNLEREIGSLRKEVQDLRDSPAAVERIARDQLGMVRKSEVVFQFPKANR
jgi:cell division protein FtsB